MASKTDPSAVKWEYSKRLEAFFQDSKYTGQQAGGEENGRQDVRWQVIGSYNNRGATSLTDGYGNTRQLEANDIFYLHYPAAQACYGGLNGLVNGGDTSFSWYLPSVSELIGTWISSASTASQLSASYWSSTALGSPNAFIITNKGEVKTAPVNSNDDRHYVRGFRDPDAVNTIH